MNEKAGQNSIGVFLIVDADKKIRTSTVQDVVRLRSNVVRSNSVK